MNTLRRYQRAPFLRILDTVLNGHGDTLALMFSRQSGKNETSAQAEFRLMMMHGARGGIGVKAAPTLTPQAVTSRDRLIDTMKSAGLRPPDYRRDGNTILLGLTSWQFKSAAPDANVVGATASMLLECDESQDVSPDKWDKDFLPMAADRNASKVHYGTAWTDTSLLARTIAECEDAEGRDGRRRVFTVPWWIVAEENPAYAVFVQNERARLGENHPIFQTQYELKTLAGAGRLLSPAQLANIRGEYERHTSPGAGRLYVAAVDVAGEDTPDVILRGRDSTVLTIGQVTHRPPPLLPLCEAVNAYEWKGTKHDRLYPEIMMILDAHRVQRVAVDSTAAGEALAIIARRALGEERVIGYRFTERSKSELGYGLQQAATTGGLKLWANDQSPEYAAIDSQLRACRAEYKPNQTVSWSVPVSEGHDDYVASLALLVHAAKECPPPALARSRPGRRP